jgi:hypothetical protein
LLQAHLLGSRIQNNTRLTSALSAIIRAASLTCLRPEELATFPKAYICEPGNGEMSARNMRATLDPYHGTGMQTKGLKPRVIYMSRDLMRCLHHYVARARSSGGGAIDFVMKLYGIDFVKAFNVLRALGP